LGVNQDDARALPFLRKRPTCLLCQSLLGDKPLIRSGRKETYAPGKDTGRYWDAGASNVHWVIVTDNQVEQGIKQALARVQAPGVFIEGNSFLKFVDVDFTVMVAPVGGAKIKAPARRVFEKTSALYLFENGTADETKMAARQRFSSWLEQFAEKDVIGALPVYPHADIHDPAGFPRHFSGK
jgi:hypothetical protein